MSGDGFNWQPVVSTLDSDGRVQPLNVRKGELANWIIIVGDPHRWERSLKLFDGGKPTIERRSEMIYCVATGTCKGKPLSVVAIGMGFLMTELFVTQARSVVEGPLKIVRLGSCGCLRPSFTIGGFAVGDKAGFVRISHEKDGPPYEIGDFVFSCGLAKRVETALRSTKWPVDVGIVVSADTFYGSQGRMDGAFDDNNAHLIESLVAKWGDELLAFEMEIFVVAAMAHRLEGIEVGCACITLAKRDESGAFLDSATTFAMETDGFRALFDMIAGA